MSDLVCVFEFEAGDDLTLQLAVGRRLVQDGLTELRDVGFTGFPQNRVQPVVWRHNEFFIKQQSTVKQSQERETVLTF